MSDRLTREWRKEIRENCEELAAVFGSHKLALSAEQALALLADLEGDGRGAGAVRGSLPHGARVVGAAWPAVGCARFGRECLHRADG